MDKAYGLTALYKQGLDGTGQTVAIVDAFGSDTIFSDANLFSQINGLPALTSGGNFNVYYPEGHTVCRKACLAGNWNIETTLDVEWAHSVAPAAGIALVLAKDNTFTNLDLSVLFAIETGLAPVISNSYGAGEILLQTFLPSELIVQNNLNQMAASLGMSATFSTGDSGDFALAIGVATVSSPASSPFATAVGGTSMFLNPDHTIKLQTGWGNNETRIANALPDQNADFAAASSGFHFWWRWRYQPCLAETWHSKRVLRQAGDRFLTLLTWEIPTLELRS